MFSHVGVASAPAVSAGLSRCRTRSGLFFFLLLLLVFLSHFSSYCFAYKVNFKSEEVKGYEVGVAVRPGERGGAGGIDVIRGHERSR